jgi:hypothetical protein
MASLELYCTVRSKFVYECINWIRWQDEPDTLEAIICDNKEQVIELFGYGWFAKELLRKEAWMPLSTWIKRVHYEYYHHQQKTKHSCYVERHDNDLFNRYSRTCHVLPAFHSQHCCHSIVVLAMARKHRCNWCCKLSACAKG